MELESVLFSCANRGSCLHGCEMPIRPRGTTLAAAAGSRREALHSAARKSNMKHALPGLVLAMPLAAAAQDFSYDYTGDTNDFTASLSARIHATHRLSLGGGYAYAFDAETETLSARIRHDY